MNKNIFILLFLPLLVLGQEAKNTSLQYQAYFDTLEEMHEGDLKKGIEMTDSLELEASKNKDKLLLSLVNTLKSIALSKQSQYKKSELILLENEALLQSLPPSYKTDSLMLENYTSLGENNQEQGLYKKAISHFNSALEKAQKTRDSILIGRTYNWLGNIYAEMEATDRAIHYYELTLLFDSSTEMREIINANLGSIYSLQGDYEKAEKHLVEALALTPEDNPYLLSMAHNNLGMLYNEKKSTDKAYFHFKKAYDFALQMNHVQYIAEQMIPLMNYYVKRNEFINAEELMQKGDSLAVLINSESFKMNMYGALFENHEKLGNHKKALDFAKKYMSSYDSVWGIEKTKAIEELEVKYNAQLKDAEIKEKENTIALQKKQQNQLILGLATLFVFLGFSIFIYRQKLKTQKVLNNERISKLLEEQKMESLKAQLSGQNQERARISKDLHDGISGNLAAIKLKLTKLAEQTEEVQNIVNSIDSTYHEVRSISHDLTPKEVSINTFTDLMQQLVDFKSSNDLELNAEFFPKENLNHLSEKYQVEIYRIVQELLTNISKHAKATNAFVNLTHHGDSLNLMVEDNGQGFKSKITTEGIGLKNIRSRLKNINGTMDIEQNTKQGTVVNINISLS